MITEITNINDKMNFDILVNQIQTTNEIAGFIMSAPSIWQTASAKLQLPEKKKVEKWQTELKANRLDYADTAQLKMYLNYFRKNIMQPDDNPPLGILMCSEVGQEMAEYTLTDMDEDMFVSKYELNIHSRERMTEFLRKENEELNPKENVL